MLGFLNAYEKSGDEKYRDAANAVWEFIKSYVITARKPAEWHSEVNRDGSPRAGHPLVDPWKCPYHNGRMCIEILSQKVEQRRMIASSSSTVCSMDWMQTYSYLPWKL